MYNIRYGWNMQSCGKGKITSNEINARIMKMLEQAIQQDGVVNVFEHSGKKIRRFHYFRMSIWHKYGK